MSRYSGRGVGLRACSVLPTDATFKDASAVNPFDLMHNLDSINFATSISNINIAD